jgi:hypothetical protein
MIGATGELGGDTIRQARGRAARQEGKKGRALLFLEKSVVARVDDADRDAPWLRRLPRGHCHRERSPVRGNPG